MSKIDLTESGLQRMFNKYAGASGKKDSMNKKELKDMLNELIPGLLKDPKNPGEVDTLMNALDQNNDNEVDFKEFVVLVTAVVNAYG